MYKTLLIIVFCFFSLGSHAQENDTIDLTDPNVISKIKRYYDSTQEVINANYTPGVIKQNDSIYFSDEYLKLANNSLYRDSVFLKPYSFENVLEALADLELQKASWYLIDLYPKHKELVIKVLYSYSNLFQVDKIIVFSVYTYGFFDPEIAKIKNGTPEVIRPDLLEEKLNIAKEISTAINYYKSLNNQSKDSIKK